MCQVETLFVCSALCKSAERAEPPSSNISGRHWHPKWIKEVPSIPATGLGDDIILLVWTHRCDLLSMMLSRLSQIPTEPSAFCHLGGDQRQQTRRLVPWPAPRVRAVSLQSLWLTVWAQRCPVSVADTTPGPPGPSATLSRHTSWDFPFSNGTHSAARSQILVMRRMRGLLKRSWGRSMLH